MRAGAGHSSAIRRNEICKRGEPLEFRKPDGSNIRSTVWTIELIGTNKQHDHVAICLPNIAKTEIPIGTEIWLTNDESI
jgi:hypothetical protein